MRYNRFTHVVTANSLEEALKACAVEMGMDGYFYTLSDNLVLVSGKCVERFEHDFDGLGEEWLRDYWYIDENLAKIRGFKINKNGVFFWGKLW